MCLKAREKIPFVYFQTTQSLVSQISETANNATSSNTTTSDNNHSMYDNFSEKNRLYAANNKAKIAEPDLIGDLNDLNNPSQIAQAAQHCFKLPTKPENFPELNVHVSRPSLPLMPSKAPSSAYGYVTTRRGSLEGRSYQKGFKQLTFRMISVPLPSHPMRNLKWIKLQDSVVGKSAFAS